MKQKDSSNILMFFCDQLRLDVLSLLPIMNGIDSGKALRPVNYGEYHGDWYGHYSVRMVTDGKYKLILNLSDLGEFYDLENGPSELENQFYNPVMKHIRNHYFKLLQQEGRKLNDAHINMYYPEVEDILHTLL